jgi:pyruvate formate lyase activating enzyme
MTAVARPDGGPIAGRRVQTGSAGVIDHRPAPDALSGWCFDIQRYSIHDGPGIRTTVFLKGCPLACPWCHNPESRDRAPEIRILAARCIDCHACTAACPLGLAEPARPPDPERCLRCGRCAHACPTGARELLGRRLTVAEVMTTVERDRPFYEESGGGVTFSGGEPLAQPGFLLACLAAARDRGIHATVDTSGFAPRETILRVAAMTDLFLYDLKVLDPERHERLIGVPLAPILDNLVALDATGAAIWLRVPLVPGVNDDDRALDALIAFVAPLRTRRLHLLPFHRLGSDKLGRIGREDPMAGMPPSDPATVERIAARLREHGLEVRVGG